MHVSRVNCKIEVKPMSLVVIDGICADKASLFYISSICVPSTVDCIELLCLFGIEEIIRYDMLHQEKAVRVADVISNLVIRISQVDPCDLFAV